MPFTLAPNDDSFYETSTETTSVILSEKTLYTLEKYTQVKIGGELAADGMKAVWEHARSYADEAVVSLILDNPELFRYSAAMQKIRDDRKKK